MTFIDIFTWAEVLQEIGVTKNTIYLWEKSGKVPPVIRDRNGKRLFTQSWLNAAIAFRDKTTQTDKEKKA